MNLTVFEISCGVGTWIGIFCLIMIFSNPEGNPVYTSTAVKALATFVIPIIIIMFIYVAFQTGILLAKIVGWILYLMFHIDILFASFLIIMTSISGLTIGNTIKLLQDKRKEETEIEVEDVEGDDNREEEEEKKEFKPKPNPFITPID